MLWNGQAPPFSIMALNAAASPATLRHWVMPPLMHTFGCRMSADLFSSRSRKRNSSPSFCPQASGMPAARRSSAIWCTSFCVSGSSKKPMP